MDITHSLSHNYPSAATVSLSSRQLMFEISVFTEVAWVNSCTNSIHQWDAIHSTS